MRIRDLVGAMLGRPCANLLRLCVSLKRASCSGHRETEGSPPTAGMGGARVGASEADAAFVRAALAARGGAAVPDNFQATAPGPSGRPGRMPQAVQRSPQTTAFLELLGLPYNLEPAPARLGCGAAPAAAPGLVPGRPAGSGAAAHGEGSVCYSCPSATQGSLPTCAGSDVPACSRAHQGLCCDPSICCVRHASPMHVPDARHAAPTVCMHLKGCARKCGCISAESNPEEIALEDGEDEAAVNPEELDIDELPDDEDVGGASMFAPVEIHNYSVGQAAAAARSNGLPLPQALANVVGGNSS